MCNRVSDGHPILLCATPKKVVVSCAMSQESVVRFENSF